MQSRWLSTENFLFNILQYLHNFCYYKTLLIHVYFQCSLMKITKVLFKEFKAPVILVNNDFFNALFILYIPAEKPKSA